LELSCKYTLILKIGYGEESYTSEETTDAHADGNFESLSDLALNIHFNVSIVDDNLNKQEIVVLEA
jgi:hypothetical protein